MHVTGRSRAPTARRPVRPRRPRSGARAGRRRARTRPARRTPAPLSETANAVIIHSIQRVAAEQRVGDREQVRQRLPGGRAVGVELAVERQMAPYQPAVGVIARARPRPQHHDGRDQQQRRPRPAASGSGRRSRETASRLLVEARLGRQAVGQRPARGKRLLGHGSAEGSSDRGQDRGRRQAPRARAGPRPAADTASAGRTATAPQIAYAAQVLRRAQSARWSILVRSRVSKTATSAAYSA